MNSLKMLGSWTQGKFVVKKEFWWQIPSSRHAWEYFSPSVILQLPGESKLHRYRGLPTPGIQIL